MTEQQQKTLSLANEIAAFVSDKIADEKGKDLAEEALLLAWHQLFGTKSLLLLMIGKYYGFQSNS